MIAFCIGCGCDDYHACLDHKRGQPCHWTRVDYGEGKGVCSVCEELAPAWDAGDRKVRRTSAERAQQIAQASEG